MNTSPIPLAELLRKHATASGETLTLQQAATHCGKSRSWLTKLQAAGLAPPSIRIGRERLYLKADLDAWLAKRGRK